MVDVVVRDDGEPDSLRIQAHADKPSVIFIASASRVDAITGAMERIVTSFPSVPVRLVLGEYWAGHRRTQPINLDPKAASTAYWYQTHDLLIPTALDYIEREAEARERPGSEPKTPDDSQLLPGRLRVSASNGSGHALVVSDHGENRRLWLDLLPSYGFQAVAAFGEQDLPEGRFDVVILDNFSDVGPEAVAKLRRVYPEAVLAAGFGFPTWSVVEPCLAAGIEVVFGKPFQPAGLVRSFSSAALARK